MLVVFRTHYWDDAVQACFDALVRSTSSKILILVDETAGAVPTPPQYDRLSHTVSTFDGMGLPLRPEPKSVLWYSADYVLYQLLREVAFEHLFMVECDCAITGPLDEMLAAMASQKLDYVANDFQPLDRARRQFVASLPYFSSADGVEPEIYGGSLPAVFLSRGAIETLYAERLVMASRDTAPDLWIYCETFVATVLHQAGFHCAPLRDFADVSRSSFLKAMRPSDIATGTAVRVFHPVLGSPRFERKWIVFYRNRMRRAQARLPQLEAQNARLQSRVSVLETAAKALRQENKQLRREQRRPRRWWPENWLTFFRKAARRVAKALG